MRIVIPEGSLLHPSPEAAVVGGNVLTSQRVVDVVLRAFGACAASQGCMNNREWEWSVWMTVDDVIYHISSYLIISFTVCCSHVRV